MMEKNRLRQQMLVRRRRLSPQMRLALGEQISQKIISLEIWKRSQVVGIYLSLPDEVPTQTLIQRAYAENKIVVAPRIHSPAQLQFTRLDRFATLESGPRNIQQPPPTYPIAPAEMDLLIVPGVAFDHQGFRLGYGKGFYDAYLSGCPAYRLGIGFDLQIVAALPIDPHDIPLQLVITEKRHLP